MDIILSDKQIAQLEEMNAELRKYPGVLDNANSSLGQVLHAPQMRNWIEGTLAAKSVETELKRNMNSINETIQSLNRIIQANESIIAWNKENNKKTVNG